MILGSFGVYNKTFAAGPPSIISYQGRLTDDSGNLLGSSSGTTYYFKFSLWSAASGGTKLWPTADPTYYATTVREGVFNVNIGDTASGYPDALTYDFSTTDLFLKVEVSDDNLSYETLSPRLRVGSTAFAQVAGAVVSASSTITNLTSDNATTTNSTSTNLYVSGNASTTNLFANILRAGSGIFTSITGSSLAGFGTRCLQTDNNGIISVAASTCGSGGGGSGGTWSTTTSQVAGQYINYPNNTTDIISVGDSSTTTAEVYFDPNSSFAKVFNQFFGLSSTTLQSFTALNGTTTNATSTSLAVSGLASTTELRANIAYVGLANLSNLFVNGSTTMQSFTASNSTTTNATTTILSNSGLLTTSQLWVTSSTTLRDLIAVNYTALGSTTLQNFTGTNGTTTNATSTNLHVSGRASTTDLRANTASIGNLSVTSCAGCTSFAFPFTTLGSGENATSTTIAFLNGFLATASSTLTNFTATNSTTTNSTSTSLAVSGLASTTAIRSNSAIFGFTTTTQLLVDSSTTLQNFTASNATTTGATTTNLYVSNLASSTNLRANVANIGALTVTSCTGCFSMSFGFPFTTLSTGENATSTTLAFLNGFISAASSTLSNVSTLLVNGSTTLQSFTAASGTIGTQLSNNSTSTNLFVSNLASTTELRSNTGIIGYLTSLFGNFTNLLATGSSTLQNFTASNATTSQATSTNLAVSSVSNSLLKTTTLGSLVAAVAGTDYENILTFGDGLTRTANDVDCDTASGSVFGCLTSSDWTTFNNKLSAMTFSFPFTRFASVDQSTTTLMHFFGGLNSTASSTIGAGAQGTGLTIFGGATTTGESLHLGSTTLQNFTATNSTTTNATTTILTNSGLLTSSQLWVTSSTTLRDLITINYLALGSTTLQNFTATNGTTTNSTSTDLYVSNLASTTSLRANVASIGNLTVTSCTGCGGSTFVFPFTTLSSGENATSTTLAFLNGFVSTASSTLTDFVATNSTTTSATSTNFYVSGRASTTEIRANLAYVGSRLGIGTINPEATLHVSSANGGEHLRFADAVWGGLAEYHLSENTPRLVLVNNGAGGPYNGLLMKSDGSGNFHTNGVSVTAVADTSLGFGTSDGTAIKERMRINSQGNVGIGTTSPYAKVSILTSHTLSDNPYALFTIASSTTSGTTTLFSIFNTGTASSTDFKANTANIGNLTVTSCTGCGSSFGFPFTTLGTGENATSTTLAFLNGFISTASSTLASTTVTTLLANSATTTNLHVSGLASTTELRSNIAQFGGSVGISSTTPWGTLSIHRSDVSSAPLFAVGSTTSLGASTSLVVLPSGLVGIGTANPTEALDVIGDISASGEIELLTSGVIAAEYNKARIWTNSSSGYHVVNSLSGTDATLQLNEWNGSLYASGIETERSLVFTIDSDNNDTTMGFHIGANNLIGSASLSHTIFSALESGNVGVGTSSPSAKFAIQASTTDTNFYLFDVASTTAVSYATTSLFSVDRNGLTRITNATTSDLKANTATIGNLTVTSCNGCGSSFGFPFTTLGTGENATSTTLAFLNGFISTASSTLSNVSTLLVNGSSTFQSFTATNSTTTNATSTSLYVSGLASTTELRANIGTVGFATLTNLLVNSSSTLQDVSTQDISSVSVLVTGLSGSGTRCVQVDNTGLLTIAGAACGTAGGGGAGSWATTTSQVTGQYINYSLNDTDIITIGSSATTSAEFWFDPNTSFAKIGGQLLITGSTTLQSFTAASGTIGTLLSNNATSTNLFVSNLASTTELRANTGIIGYLTSLFGNFTNLLATGSSTLQTFTATNATTSQATSTNLAVSSLTSALVKAGSDGSLVEAVAGTDYENILTFGDSLTRTGDDVDCDVASGSQSGCLSTTDWNTFNNKLSSMTFSFPFTTGTDWGTHNATSTLLGFKGGFYSLASSTIGNNTTASGLTIFGGATTTGESLTLGSTTLQAFTFNTATGTSATTTNLYVSGRASTTELRANTALFGGSVGIGTSSPITTLDVYGNAILSGDNRYLNFASSSGSGGYGIRDNGGIVEIRNMGGFWTRVGAASTTAKTATYIVAASDSRNKELADFIADGTNDQVQIQQAIDLLPSTGGSVYLMEGTYNIGTSTPSVGILISSKNNVTLQGAGAGTVIKLHNSLNGEVYMIRVSSSQNVRLSSFTIDGNKANNTFADTYAGINLSSAASSTIENLLIKDFQDAAIRLDASDSNLITGNTITNSGSGTAALYFWSQNDNNVVSNNIISYNNQNGIDLNSGDTGTVVTGNTITKNVGSGVNAVCSGCSVVGNNLSYNLDYGLVLGGNAMTVTGNIISNNTDAGIRVNTSSNHLISGNTFRYNLGYGVYIWTSGNNITISSNTFYGNGHGGSFPSIYVGSTANNISVNNNTIEATSTDALISVQSGATLVSIGANTFANPDTSTFISDSGTNTRYSQFDRLTLNTNNTGQVSYALFNILASSSASLLNFTQAGSGNIFSFNNATGTALILGNTGMLGLGTTSPHAKLSIHASSTDNSFFLLDIASSTSAFATSSHFSVDRNGQTRLINLLALGSSTLQSFTGASGTIGTLLSNNSTSTNLFVSNLASTTALRSNSAIFGIATTTELNVSGSTTLQNFTASNSTTTSATSTNFFTTNASTTNLRANVANIGALTVTSCTGCTVMSFAFPFTTLGTGENATSTTLAFLNGFISTASSTLTDFLATNGTTTNATSTNLFVSGRASTTELRANTALFGGNVGIGTSSPSASFAITGSGTGSGRNFVIGDSADAERLSVLDNGIITFRNANLAGFQFTDNGGAAPQINFQYNGESRGSITGGSGPGGDFNIASLSSNGNIITTPHGTGYTLLGGKVGIGTSTPLSAQLSVSSSTGSQLALTDTSLTNSPWNFRSLGNFLYIATSSPTSGATSSVSALSITSGGIVTIPNVATTTQLNANVANIGNLTVTSCTGCGGGSTFSFPFTTLGTGENATSTTLAFTNGFLSTASSTLTGSTTLATTLMTNATATNLFVSNIASTTDLRANVATIGNLTVTSCTGCYTLTHAFPFTTGTDWGTHNATSTLLGFKGGFYSLASSTIGNNTTASGLTIFGGATTTGQALFLGSTTLQNFTATNSTTTNATSTNLFVSGRASTTELYTGTITIPSGSFITSNGNFGMSFRSPNSYEELLFGSAAWPDTFALGSNGGTIQRFALPSNGVLQWSDQSSITSGVIDTGLVRLDVGKLGVGNGAVGNSSGTLVAGNIGIGTTSPYANLSILSSHTSSNNPLTIFTIASSTASGTTTLFSVLNTGIATTTQLNANVANIGALTVTSCTGCSSGSSFAFPFTTLGTGENATSTTLAFLNGFISTASSTLSTILALSSTTLQDFTASNSTTTNATTTNFSSGLVNITSTTATSTFAGPIQFGTTDVLRYDGQRLELVNPAITGYRNLEVGQIRAMGNGYAGLAYIQGDASTGLRLASSIQVSFSSTNDAGTIAADVGIGRHSAGILRVTNGSTGGGTIVLDAIGVATTSPFAKLSVFAHASSTYQHTLFAVASSTAAYATSTLFTVEANGLTTMLNATTSDLKANTATIGNLTVTSCTGCGGAGTFAWPFTKQAGNEQATTTIIEFVGGFLSNASSTLTDFLATNGTTTNATSTNLYVSGRASTTELRANDIYVGNRVGIGTTTPSQSLYVVGRANIGYELVNDVALYLNGATANGVALYLDTTNGQLQFRRGDDAGDGKDLKAGRYMVGINGNDAALSTTGLEIEKDLIVGWTGTDEFYDAKDISISRISSGILGVGTGAAGEIDGTLVAGSLWANSSSTFQNFTASNSTTTGATTTNLFVSNLASSTNLRANVASIGNLTVTSCTGCTVMTFSFPFTTGTDWGTHNATSTLLGFKGGFYSLASSTIGNNTTASGLTIFGGATTTGESLVLGSSTLQTFTAASGTIEVLLSNRATTTDLYVSNLASTTNLRANVANFGALTVTSCTGCGGAGTFAWPFTKLGTNEQATSTIMAWTGGFLSTASSTLTGSTTLSTTLMTNATATNLHVSDLASTTNLRANVANIGALTVTSCTGCGGAGTFAWPFTKQAGNEQATTTIIEFVGGFLSNASSTLTDFFATNGTTTNATSTSFFVSGIASTTELRSNSAYFGRVGIGLTNPSEALEVEGQIEFDGDFKWGTAAGFARLTDNSNNVIGYFQGTQYQLMEQSMIFNGGASAVAVEIAGNSGKNLIFNTTGGGVVAVATATPRYQFQVASSTAPQLALSYGAGVNHWIQRNTGGIFDLATSSHTSFATSSVSALKIDVNGIVTIANTATTTQLNANVASIGNLTVTSCTGCGGAGTFAWPFTKQAGNEQATSTIMAFTGGFLSTASSTLTGSTTLATTLMTNATATNLHVSGLASTTDLRANTALFGGNVGVGSTTPWGNLSVHKQNPNNDPIFAVSSSTSLGASTTFVVMPSGNVGIGLANPTNSLDVNGSVNIKGGAIDLSSGSSNAVGLWASGLTTIAFNSNGSSAGAALLNGAQWNVRGDTGTIGWVESSNVVTLPDVAFSRLSAGVVGLGTGLAGSTAGTLVAETIGIGTSSPYAKLSILSSHTLSNNPFTIFTIASSTASGTTTLFSVSNTGIATTTQLNANVANIGALTVTSCTGCGGAGTFAWPYTKQAGNEQATTTVMEFVGGLLSNASSTFTGSTTLSTTLMTNATSTNFYVSGLASTTELRANVANIGNLTVTSCTGCGGGGMSIGGSITDATEKSILFAGPSGVLAQNNFRFNWDNTNNRLGIGTSSPFAQLSIHAFAGQSNQMLFAIASSTASATTTLFSVSNTGTTTIGDISGTGDAVFQMANDNNAWSMGYFSVDKTFRIASSTNLFTNVYFQIGKSGTTTFSSGLGAESGSDEVLCIDPTTFEMTRGGASCAASSLRFKENIEDLSYGLGTVMQLRPVSYEYNEAERPGSDTRYLGFIAEDMLGIVPEVVEIDGEGLPGGIDYAKLTPVLAKAIQEMNLNLETIASTTATTTTSSLAFAESFFNNIFARITTWLADAANGIQKFFAKEVHTETLCVKKSDGSEICLTGDQLSAMLMNSGGGYTVTDSPAPTPETDPNATTTPPTDPNASTTPPTVTSDTPDAPAEPEIGTPTESVGAEPEPSPSGETI